MIVPKSSGRKKGPGSRRRGGRGTKSLDAALLLGQAMAPLAARPGWSPQTLAANSDLPYAQMLDGDPRMAGAAARPVIRPKTVVVDNAKIFKARHFRDVCSMLGIEVESARERTPTDKAVIERTNASVKSMFSQFAAGYTGNSLATRGKDVERERLWTLNELQDLWHEWVVDAFTDRRSSCTGSELRRFIDYMFVTTGWGGCRNPLRGLVGWPVHRDGGRAMSGAGIPEWALVLLAPEQVVRHAARAGHDLQVKPVEQLIG
ncbi:hypothetical protein ABZV31_38155 [Streptomyces sp. NPDC005202]|uniref:hypothetical protein n=1 Tax=Streptomyces sp. NPDC005202 TaxID=3157021 RepID=UPI0033AC7CC8